MVAETMTKSDEIVAKLRHTSGVIGVPITESVLLNAAADLIEQLQQELIDERYRHDRLQDFCVAQGEELSRLKAQQRWIPVTERLPEDDDDVLIMSSGSISMGYYSIYNEYWADYINVYNSDVTHWMRLPERPEEDE